MGQTHTVELELELYDGTRKAQVSVPAGMRVGELLQEACRRWKLDEQRDYRLVYAERATTGGVREVVDLELPEDGTLSGCGVGPGARLVVYPLLVAGSHDAAARAFAAVRARRLAQEHLALQQLAAASEELVRIVAVRGEPPHGFELELRCLGVVAVEPGRTLLARRHRVHIAYPPGFPRPGEVPEVRFLSPVQHLHVFADGRVCLGALAGPDEPLDALVVRLFELLQCEPRLLDLHSPANHRMVQWTRTHLPRLPLGRLRPRLAGLSPPATAGLRWTEV